MTVLRVTCISRDQTGSREVVKGVGGEDFYHSADQAISYISSRTHQYWTEIAGESVWLTVAEHANGSRYLTAHGHLSPDNLLILAECEFTLGGTSSIEADAEAMVARVGDLEQGSLADFADRLALRTTVRLLVLNRYGRDDARLSRNREDAIVRACGVIENLDLPEEAREQLQEAVRRDLEILFAPPAQR
jgi:hypothetical protein